MFKIKEVEVNGLPGFEDKLELKLNNSLTTLIGPNGSGKTTTLKVINSLVSFLNMCKFDLSIDQIDNWTSWNEATIKFESEDYFENKWDDLEALGSQMKELAFTVIMTEKKFYIKRVMSEYGGVEVADFDNLFLESEELARLRDELDANKSLETEHDSKIKTLRGTRNSQTQINAFQKKLDEAKNKAKKNESDIARESIELLNFVSGGLRRSQLCDFLRTLRLPEVKFVKFGETDFSNIENSISRIAELKAGIEPDTKYDEIKNQLQDLLQQKPHFYSKRDDNIKDFLNINGVDYSKTSTGTRICIFYFSLIFETNENDLVIWDEPENGLHQTRRFKLLDLILGDTRQFLIATHATELAPVFDEKCSVIRTSCEHRVIDGQNYISFYSTKDKIGAFKLADSLGLSPARLLFTANVAIWVEGPSDMIFWRKAIELHPDGQSFVEGFDYTFLMYGGKCISHLTALETNEQLDILAISSHPIFIVDSDISNLENFSEAETHLKAPAKRILDSFRNPDLESGTNLFMYSNGREMENYLPMSSIKYAIKKIATTISDDDISSLSDSDWGRHEKYFDYIGRKFEERSVGTRSEDSQKFKPKAYTRWGDSNKTEVVKRAIESECFLLENLNYDGQSDVEQIVEFIGRWQV